MNYFLKNPTNYRGTYPLVGKICIASSFLGLLLSGYSWIRSSSAQKQVEWRKNQLSLPVHRLSEDEHIKPPWNADNIDEWLYRSVEIGERPLHRLTCLVPHFENGFDGFDGFDGFENVIFLLSSQEADRSNPQWLILSKGFIRYDFRETGTRYRIEDSTYQKFIGFVSKLPEHANQSLFKGNSTNDEKVSFTYANTEDFGTASGFTNKKQAGVAIIEKLHQFGVRLKKI